MATHDEPCPTTSSGAADLPDSRTLARRIRVHAVRMTSRGNSSHVGSSLSMADLIAVLYAGGLRVDPTRPRWPGRDRFILSKGHASAGLYAALAERGFFDLSLLDSHCQDGSHLSGHVTTKGVPGVELATGSLGHGLPVATGMALAARMAGERHRVIALLSDGECDEGSNWEAILFAAHHELDNLVAIIDYNKLQSLKPVEQTLRLEPFAEKWRSFGWYTVEIDGHDHDAVRGALSTAAGTSGRPTCLIAHTVKGKGVPFMENSILWHYRSPQGAERDAALDALERGA
ncbi:transketolase [Marinivivus vitaminiproducens]|uniref:transketolase n=1 Tax=Marinivivus vitaminiproducens TaxID=3035935 RepID=UPI0027A80B5F|nr:transketolase [Geminicoccaceae bacterium SCSIO 64248]